MQGLRREHKKFKEPAHSHHVSAGEVRDQGWRPKISAAREQVQSTTFSWVQTLSTIGMGCRGAWGPYTYKLSMFGRLVGGWLAACLVIANWLRQCSAEHCTSQI